MNRFHRILGLAAAAAMIGAAAPAFASTSVGNTQDLGVGATIAGNCNISAPTALSFTYDPVVTNASTPTKQSTSFTVACTNGMTVALSITNGSNAGKASGSSRAMANNSNYLGYELYSDSNDTTVWGGSNTVSYTSSSAATSQTENIYAVVPAGQDAAIGSYSDTVTIAASF